ncbi:MAG: DUF116 domain-containing protein [Candidatus Humimicrobiaceae bacterium]
MEQKNIKLKTKSEEELAKIDPTERVLLLPHCLRHSETCEAKMTREGLQCRDSCQDKCSIGRLRLLAQKLGYKGVCIAPGGSLAIKFIKRAKPRAIIAIACEKELEEGICTVREVAEKMDLDFKPAIITVPLSRDGCVDTEVNEKEAARIIKL